MEKHATSAAAAQRWATEAVGEQEFPSAPETLEETGLDEEFVTELVLKTLYSLGVMQGDRLEKAIKIPYKILDDLLLSMQQRRLVEVRGTQGHGRRGYRFDLTEEGRGRAREAMSVGGYVGPAPVTMQQYWKWVNAQSVRNVRITRDEVVEGFRHLVLDEDFIETIGPAINSGRSVFLYGHPGNGKTIIAEAIAEMFGGDLFIPHAILVEGDVVQLFDPVYHRLIEEEEGAGGDDFLRRPDQHDQRFLHIERPVVIVGGELTLDQLELQHDPDTGVFRAPPQVKANGGVFVIDDFGRQRVRPRDLLNRWMYPLERQMDFLGLPTGQKLAVPFDTLLVFATNLNPADLVEEAFLRRIRYKIFVESPSKDQFEEIFRRTAGAKEVPFNDQAVEFVYGNFYQRMGISPRKCHPRDLINQIIDMAGYLDTEPRLTEEMLNRACQAYFMDSAMMMGPGGNGAGESGAEA